MNEMKISELISEMSALTLVLRDFCEVHAFKSDEMASAFTLASRIYEISLEYYKII